MAELIKCEIRRDKKQARCFHKEQGGAWREHDLER